MLIILKVTPHECILRFYRDGGLAELEQFMNTILCVFLRIFVLGEDRTTQKLEPVKGTIF